MQDKVLHHLVKGPEYSMIFANKKLDLMNMEIILANGIPNTGRRFKDLIIISVSVLLLLPYLNVTNNKCLHLTIVILLGFGFLIGSIWNIILIQGTSMERYDAIKKSIY